MDSFIGFIIIVWMIICSAIVPLMIYDNYANRLECQEKHNVYRCEKIVTWQPVETEIKDE